MECNICPEVIDFHQGMKGKNSDIAKIMFILNKPDRRILQKSLGFFDDYETALMNTKTGSEINNILKHCGLSQDDVYLTNIYKCVKKQNRDPGIKEYKNCFKTKLISQIDDFQPEKIVAFGIFSYIMMFDIDYIHSNHEKAWGKKLQYKNFPVLIMPHPSRIWAFRNEGKKKVFYEQIKSFLNGKQ